jgi:hypothetical protein
MRPVEAGTPVRQIKAALPPGFTASQYCSISSEQLVQTTLNKTLFFLLSCSFFMVDFVPTGHTLSGEACQHRSAPHAAFNGVENTVEEYQAADRHQTHDT